MFRGAENDKMYRNMVDVFRAYRRWVARRMAVLGSAFLLILGIAVWFARHPEAALWLKLVAVPLAALTLLLLGHLAAQTLSCAILQARGRRGEARAGRSSLALSRGAAVFSLVFAAVMILAPRMFRQTGRPEGPQVRSAGPAGKPRRDIARLALPVEPESLAPEPEGEPAPASAPSQMIPVVDTPPPPAPSAEEAIRVPPLDGDFPEAAAAPAAAGSEDEFGMMPRFPWEEIDPFGPSEGTEALGIRRPALGEEEGGTWPLPEFRLDVLYLGLDGYEWGLGMAFLADIPVGRRDLVRATWLTGLYFLEGNLEDGLGHGPQIVWNHATVEYVRRLVGYSTESPFDLAVTAGLGVDRMEGSAGYGEVNPSMRLGPHVAVEAGIWQGGPAGFVVRFAQSIPANITGSVSSVTDLSAVARVDLSEGVSLHAGYRILRIRLRDYPDPLDAGPGRWEMEETSRGPLVGLAVRF